MNTAVKAVIESPAGRTREIELEEVVRQGTVWGPTLCGVSTDKINEIKDGYVTFIGPNIEIGIPVFVDDIYLD